LPETPRVLGRIENEDALLRAAAVVGLLRAEYAMRVGEEERHTLFAEEKRYSLFFPSRVRRAAPAVKEQEEVLFHFSGALDNVFAALVIRLARSGLFRLNSTWTRRALFLAGPSGEACSLTLRGPSQRDGELVLGFGRKVSEETRLRFDEYVKSQLGSRVGGGGVQRERRFFCPSCGQMVADTDAVASLRAEGGRSIPCSYCDTNVPLTDRDETADDSQHATIARMNHAADARRRLDVAALTLRGKTLAKDYDVFFSYSYSPIDDKRVKELDALLNEQGILAWRGATQSKSGSHFAGLANDSMRASRAVLFVVGESRFSGWQTDELNMALKIASEKPLRLATILVGHPEGVPSVPEQLTRYPIINMQEFTPAAMAQLVEFITGRGDAYVDPNATRIAPEPPPQPRAAVKPEKPKEEERHTPAGSLRFDRNRFFRAYTSTVTKLNQPQVSGIDRLLGFIEDDPKVDDVRAAAFILALVQSETANMWHPLEDLAARKMANRYEPGTALGKSLGNTQKGDGLRFRGRGYIQITGRANYQRLGGALGIDLVANPDAAQEPATAYRIMSEALYRGLLTGKKLTDFIRGAQVDYKNLLKVLRVQDPSSRVLKMIHTLENILRSSLVKPDAAPQKETPPAAPETPRAPAEKPAPAKESASASSRKSAKKSSRKASSKKTKSRSSSSGDFRSKKSSRKSSRKSSVKKARPKLR
jgi:putative chitinase